MLSQQTITHQKACCIVCQVVRGQMVPADGKYNLEKGAYYVKILILESPVLSITKSILNLWNKNMRGFKCGRILLFRCCKICKYWYINAISCVCRQDELT